MKEIPEKIQRKKIYKKFLKGKATLNQVREKYGLSPIDNGDTLVTIAERDKNTD